MTRNQALSLLPSGVRKQYELTKDVPFERDDRAVLVTDTESILHVNRQEGDQVWYSPGQLEVLCGPVDRADLIMLKVPVVQAEAA